MALIHGLLMAGSLFTVSASADDAVVKKSDCKIAVYKNKKWETRTKLPYSVGQTVKTKPIPGRASQVYVWVGDGYAAVPLACLEGSEPEPASAPGMDGSSTARVPSLKKKSIYLTISYLSWSERIRLEENSTYVSLLNANQVGMGFGAGMRLRAGRRSQWDLSGQIVITNSQVGPSAQSLLSGSANYSSQNSGTFGLLVRPGYFLYPGSETLALGVSIPLIYRIANWQNPSDSARFLEKAAFRYGIQLDTQIRRGDWGLGTRIGFIQSLLGFAWDLNLSKSF